MADTLTNLHPEDVKAAVRKRGKTLQQLSLDAGLSKAACRVSLLRPVPRANQAIAQFLEKRLHELWPEWYAADGSRNSSPSRTDHIRRGHARHGEKSAGA